MNGIGKHAAFYRAYLPHDRSLIPVAVALGVIVALWLCLYFISEEQNPQTAQRRSPRCGGARLPTCQSLIARETLVIGFTKGRCSWPADAQQRH